MSMTNAEMLEIADRRGNEGDVDEAPFISLPQPPDALFYGDIGVWSEQATRHSEASRVAVFASLMTYVGNVLGRNVCLYQGDTAHHSRLLFLHVGRTARGRKGTAIAPTERLHEALMRLDEVADRLACSNSSQPPEKTAPQLHMGGLSTREGLAYAIRDPSRKWDRDAGEWVEDDPGIADKRLFVVESEFENILQQGSRDGNTLSSAIRDAFDGRDLAPLTKTNRTTASNPHISLVGHVTPADLLGLLKERAISNGFLNRWMVIWAEREKLVPRPRRTPTDVVNGWASTLYAAAQWARKPREMELSDDAWELYDGLYMKEWSRVSPVAVVAALLERRPVVALRIAMTLAALERRTIIEPEHLACGAAWARYWESSVLFIWRERAQLEMNGGIGAKAMKNADRIVEFLKRKGEATRTEIYKECFGCNESSKNISDALHLLQERKKVRHWTTEKPGTARNYPMDHFRLEDNTYNTYAQRTVQTRATTDDTYDTYDTSGCFSETDSEPYEQTNRAEEL